MVIARAHNTIWTSVYIDAAVGGGFHRYTSDHIIAFVLSVFLTFFWHVSLCNFRCCCCCHGTDQSLLLMTCRTLPVLSSAMLYDSDCMVYLRQMYVKTVSRPMVLSKTNKTIWTPVYISADTTNIKDVVCVNILRVLRFSIHYYYYRRYLILRISLSLLLSFYDLVYFIIV